MDEHKQTYADIVLSPDKVVELTKEKLEEIEAQRLRADPSLTKWIKWSKWMNEMNELNELDIEWLNEMNERDEWLNEMNERDEWKNEMNE